MSRLYILGVGQHSVRQLTAETLEALDECDIVFSLLTSDQYADFPDVTKKKFRSVWSLYRPDRPRSDNYDEVTNLILDATASHETVGWLTWGNPRILDSVSQNLATEGRVRKFEVITLAAISSIDTVLIDMDYDPANGVLVVEATTAVLRRTPFIPHIAALIFQPGVFGTFYPRLRADDRGIDLQLLQDHLLHYYPLMHSVAFVSSSGTYHVPPQVDWCEIGELAKVNNLVLRNSTVFVPPVAVGEIDQEFLAAIEAENQPRRL